MAWSLWQFSLEGSQLAGAHMLHMCLAAGLVATGLWGTCFETSTILFQGMCCAVSLLGHQGVSRCRAICASLRHHFQMAGTEQPISNSAPNQQLVGTSWDATAEFP